MALDAGSLHNSLKSTLKSSLDSHLGAAPDEGDGHRTTFCDAFAKALAEEIVKHILDDLEVIGIEVQIPGGTYLKDATGGAGMTGTVPGTPIIPMMAVAPADFSQGPMQKADGRGLVK